MNHRRSHSFQVTPASRSAFTLIELAAIAGVIAILACLSLPAMARAKGQSRRTQCAANLRQFALALHLYGAEFQDRLPPNSAGGNWVYDMPWNIGILLNGYGAPWQIMYCPGTAPRFSSVDNYNLYNFSPGSFHVLGYALTFEGIASLIATNANPTVTPQSIKIGLTVYPPPLPAKRVLIADATISGGGQYDFSQRYTYNWTDIAGGYPVHHTSPHISPSVNRGIPVGGNQAMLDGHVEWRKFQEMVCRAQGGGPGFWW